MDCMLGLQSKNQVLSLLDHYVIKLKWHAKYDLIVYFGCVRSRRKRI